MTTKDWIIVFCACTTILASAYSLFYQGRNYARDLAVVADQVTAERQRIGVLAGRLAAFETQLDGPGGLSALAGRLDDQGRSLAASDRSLGDITARLDAATADVAALRAELGDRWSALSERLDALEGRHQAHGDTIRAGLQAQGDKLTTLAVQVDALALAQQTAQAKVGDRFADVSARMDDLAVGLSNADARGQVLREHIQVAQNAVAALVGRLDEAGGLPALSERLAGVVAALQAMRTEASAQVSDMRDRIDGLATQIATGEGERHTLGQSINAMETTVRIVADQLGEVAAAQTTLADRQSTEQISVTDRLATLTAEQSTLGEAIRIDLQALAEGTAGHDRRLDDLSQALQAIRTEADDRSKAALDRLNQMADRLAEAEAGGQAAGQRIQAVQARLGEVWAEVAALAQWAEEQDTTLAVGVERLKATETAVTLVGGELRREGERARALTQTVAELGDRLEAIAGAAETRDKAVGELSETIATVVASVPPLRQRAAALAVTVAQQVQAGTALADAVAGLRQDLTTLRAAVGRLGSVETAPPASSAQPEP